MNQHSPRGFNFLPPVVKNLLILNGLAFLAYIAFMQAFRMDLNQVFGLHVIGSEEFKFYQPITYMFMHGGFTHILFNMFALWMFGTTLEQVWGPKRFLIYYMVTGIGAGLVHYGTLYYEMAPTLSAIDQFLDNPSTTAFAKFVESEYFQVNSYAVQDLYKSLVPQYNLALENNASNALTKAVDFMFQYRDAYLNGPVVVGASGAVFGLLLAFGMLFPNSTIYLYFAFPIKAKYFVILYGLFELYAGFSNNPGDNVAHFAHLGGMLFGIILILYWRNGKWK